LSSGHKEFSGADVKRFFVTHPHIAYLYGTCYRKLHWAEELATIKLQLALAKVPGAKQFKN